MTVISVLCRSDAQLHLAPTETGLGASSYTLCLERWTKREPCREDSEICSVCIAKWKEKN